MQSFDMLSLNKIKSLIILKTLFFLLKQLFMVLTKKVSVFLKKQCNIAGFNGHNYVRSLGG